MNGSREPLGFYGMNPGYRGKSKILGSAREYCKSSYIKKYKSTYYLRIYISHLHL